MIIYFPLSSIIFFIKHQIFATLVPGADPRWHWATVLTNELEQYLSKILRVPSHLVQLFHTLRKAWLSLLPSPPAGPNWAWAWWPLVHTCPCVEAHLFHPCDFGVKRDWERYRLPSVSAPLKYLILNAIKYQKSFLSINIINTQISKIQMKVNYIFDSDAAGNLQTIL